MHSRRWGGGWRGRRRRGRFPLVPAGVAFLRWSPGLRRPSTSIIEQGSFCDPLTPKRLVC
jgi:hypothetical protein